MYWVTIIIIFFLIYIILLSSFYGSTKKYIHEGLAGATVTANDMQMPITKSDLVTILNEQIGNMNKHELLLSRLDTKYTASTLPSSADLKNIDTIHITTDSTGTKFTLGLPSYLTKILNILKTEDSKISDLLSTYVLNGDIDGLIDGTLLSGRAKTLYNKSHHPESMEECDASTIQKLINSHQSLLDNNSNADDTTKNMWRSTIGQLKMKQASITAVDSSVPNNTKCDPPLTVAGAESIMDAIYANYITKIVQSHDEALQTITKNRDTYIINFYQNLA
jgi:hypothetical protein